MTQSQARSMLGEAFGPGDFLEAIQQTSNLDVSEWDLPEAEGLMDWIAAHLADEDEESVDG